MPRLIDPRLNRHKGSLLILVVVIIVLVTVAGVIYVQVARSDRAATSRMHQNNIDQVIQSTVAYMQRVLLENLVDEDGNFLNTANGKSGYDYPWTNTDNPGQGDNMFLATTLPDFSAGTPRWRHLSNLMGERINPADGNRAPFIAENSNVALTNAILNADADGNGVRDSTFQPAPVFQIGDVQYIIAPRIVDLSSLVNLNVATRLPTAAADARWIRGYHPTDVNLAFLFGLAQSGGMAELDALLSSRGVTNWQSHGLESTQPPAPGSLSPATRAGHWVNEARIWDHRRQRFDIYEEAALRYRGGLNDSRTTGILETILPGVIRSDSGATRVSQLVGGDAPAQLASYYRGGTSASFSDRTFPTLRHLLTTLSGHSAIATKWGGADFPEPPAPGRLPRYDLTRQHTSPGEAVQRIEELYKRFFAAMTAGAAPFYLNFSAAEVETASLEAALAVHAYSSTSSAVP
ncbi:MAG: hypothetical protein JJU36_09665, partial [Phycisphaeraceae bacterium]|nr:hypothetical protein [Phycisphaeraceae bacterium]